jgi:hypothetical protein
MIVDDQNGHGHIEIVAQVTSADTPGFP